MQRPASFGQVDESKEDVTGLSWWRASEDFTTYSGADASIALIVNTINSKPGGYDGLLGFSQGAAVISLFCALYASKHGKSWLASKQREEQSFEVNSPSTGRPNMWSTAPALVSPLPRFVILCGGFVPRATEFTSLFSTALMPEADSGESERKHHPESGISCPSLHIMGAEDATVELVRQEQLMYFYSNPVPHIHSGGHFIPTSSEHAAVYRRFLVKFDGKSAGPLDLEFQAAKNQEI